MVNTSSWFSHRYTKMYNSVKLRNDDWCYQRNIWEDNLDQGKIPEEKVIKTLIYGVNSNGNQAEHGLRETARLSKAEYPKVSNIICKDIYVDDCLSGERSEELAKICADQMEIVLNRGGFALKGVSFSGKDPPECLTNDGSSVSVAGVKWYPKDNIILLDIGDLNFAKRLRGRKRVDEVSMRIPVMLTRRHCASKVAEVFDLTGKVMPLISSM